MVPYGSHSYSQCGKAFDCLCQQYRYLDILGPKLFTMFTNDRRFLFPVRLECTIILILNSHVLEKWQNLHCTTACEHRRVDREYVPFKVCGIVLLCLHSYWSSSVSHEKGTFVASKRSTLFSIWRALALIEQ